VVIDTPTSSPPLVLVVDDDQDTVTSTAMLLELCGFQVKTARDGSTALSLAMQARLDLILLDLGLPNFDGYAVASALRKHALDPAPLLVAVSGYGRPEDVARCAQAGFDLHLLKPVAPEVLMHIDVLMQRATTVFDTARQLAAQHSIAVAALLAEQLKMAATCIDLAVCEKRTANRALLLDRGLDLCERVAARGNVVARDSATLTAEIAALRMRIASIAAWQDASRKDRD
jgi:CheY-like chemotaxis protein